MQIICVLSSKRRAVGFLGTRLRVRVARSIVLFPPSLQVQCPGGRSRGILAEGGAGALPPVPGYSGVGERAAGFAAGVLGSDGAERARLRKVVHCWGRISAKVLTLVCARSVRRWSKLHFYEGQRAEIVARSYIRGRYSRREPNKRCKGVTARTDLDFGRRTSCGNRVQGSSALECRSMAWHAGGAWPRRPRTSVQLVGVPGKRPGGGCGGRDRASRRSAHSVLEVAGRNWTLHGIISVRASF